MTSDHHSCLFFQSVSGVTAHLLLSSHIDMKVCCCVASLSPNDKLVTFYKNG